MDAICDSFLEPYFSVKVYSDTLPYGQIKKSILEQKILLEELGYKSDWKKVFDLNDLNLSTLKLKSMGTIEGYEYKRGVLKTKFEKRFPFYILIYPKKQLAKIDTQYEDISSRDLKVLNKDVKEIQKATSLELKRELLAGPY